MKNILKYLISAILFSVWAMTFGILFLVQGNNLIGPIFTGIAAVVFWLLFASEQIENKKLKEQIED